MEIKNIKKMKNGKYKLELDSNDKIVTYDEVILNQNLLFNKKIDMDILNSINIETSYYDIYNKVIKYISTKMRSKKEIINFLDKKELDEKDKEKIINDLIKVGLINDNMFARAFTSDKIYLSNYGRLKIKKELLEHDIEENVIDDILSKYEDNVFEEKLKKLMEKKTKNAKYSGYILEQKLIYEFNNLGYETDMIRSIFNNLSIKSNIDSDYDKYYKTLAKKYEGKELINKLKNKLYSRGYSIDEINNIINEKEQN